MPGARRAARAAARSALDAGRRPQGLVLPQDRALELLQLRSRLEAELVHEQAPRLVEDLQRLRLAPRPVEREHQLGPRPLSVRVPGDQDFEVGHDVGVPADLQLGVHEVLARRELELLEPSDLGRRERLVGEVGQRRPEQRQRRADPSARSSSSAARAAISRSKRVTSTSSGETCSW